MTLILLQGAVESLGWFPVEDCRKRKYIMKKPLSCLSDPKNPISFLEFVNQCEPELYEHIKLLASLLSTGTAIKGTKNVFQSADGMLNHEKFLFKIEDTRVKMDLDTNLTTLFVDRGQGSTTLLSLIIAYVVINMSQKDLDACYPRIGLCHSNYSQGIFNPIYYNVKGYIKAARHERILSKRDTEFYNLVDAEAKKSAGKYPKTSITIEPYNDYSNYELVIGDYIKDLKLFNSVRKSKRAKEILVISSSTNILKKVADEFAEDIGMNYVDLTDLGFGIKD